MHFFFGRKLVKYCILLVLEKTYLANRLLIYIFSCVFCFDSWSSPAFLPKKSEFFNGHFQVLCSFSGLYVDVYIYIYIYVYGYKHILQWGTCFIYLKCDQWGTNVRLSWSSSWYRCDLLGCVQTAFSPRSHGLGGKGGGWRLLSEVIIFDNQHESMLVKGLIC